MKRSGYSFCILAGGRRPDKLSALIDSIHRQHAPSYEIVVAGDATSREDAVVIQLPELARQGRTNTLRNMAASKTTFDHLVFCDDDVWLGPQWLVAVGAFSNQALLGTRLWNLDGTRHWDWSTHGGTRGHALLDYAENDDWAYLAGGLTIMLSETWNHYPWDGSLGYGQGEDRALCHSARKAGIRPTACTDAIAIHDDSSYTQIGRKVVRRTLNEATEWSSNALSQQSMEDLAHAVMDAIKTHDVVSAVDRLRHTLYRRPDYASAASLLSMIEHGCGGPIDSGRWQPTPVDAGSVERFLTCTKPSRC